MDSQDGFLLETKLHAPPRRSGVLSRARLDERLAPSDMPPVVLVSAPAGFGKTTLLALWLAHAEQAGARTAWLALDPRDSDPALFWSYVIGALRRTHPDLGAVALGILRSSPHATEAAVASLVNELAGLDDIVLVLDDYHAIESLGVHESMRFFIDHLPPRFHLFVATRADPPFPLPRLRARGELLEIRADDLRFTLDETTSYLNGTAGLELAEHDVEALESRTEGWIAALQLAAISLRDRNDRSAFIAEFAGDDRFVVDYLADEVLDRQPGETRSFLLETSILNRFSAELCAAVTGRDDSRTILESLERSNLFLVALDDRRRWFRYHHLFADVLRARLAEERPDEVAALHLRACDWLRVNGDDAEAVDHALAANDLDRAAELIELVAPTLRRQRQEGTLRRWLEALPVEVLADRPVLAISLVGARMATGVTTGVDDLLRAVESLLAPSAQPVFLDEREFAALPAQVEVYRAALELLAGNTDGTIVHATAALGLIEPADHLRRGSASALLALAHWSTGALDAAADLYAEAVSALVAADHLPDALGCSLALADVHIARGRLTDAAATLEAGLALTDRHPGLRGGADMHVGLSEVLIERDDLEAADQHLRASAELGESAGLPQNAYRWKVAMARLCRARGDLERALDLIDDAAPLYDTDFSPPVRPVAAIRARVLLAAGELDAASSWADRCGLSIADDPSYVHEYEHITCARVLLARHAAVGDDDLLDDAVALLERLLDAAERGDRTGSVIEVLILQAAANQQRGDLADASAAIEAALGLAARDGHVRLFLHAGPALTALVRSTCESGDVTAHTERVLAALPDPSPAARPSHAESLVDQLSPRELDVLRLLRTELSGPEIASELVVSLNTVRSHTKSIFAKLGATNRRSAVRRADELGL